MFSKNFFHYILLLTRSVSSLKVSLISPLKRTLLLSPIVHKPIKLPVWPVVGGVLAQLADWTGNYKLAESIIENIGELTITN